MSFSQKEKDQLVVSFTDKKAAEEWEAYLYKGQRVSEKTRQHITHAVADEATAQAMLSRGFDGAADTSANGGSAFADLVLTDEQKYRFQHAMSSASIKESIEGKVMGDTGFLKIRLEPGSNPPGGFQGGGTGNKALYSYYDYDGIAAMSIPTIKMVWENKIGTKEPYVHFLLDLNGDGSVVKICSLDAALSSNAPTDPSPTGPLNSDWTVADLGGGRYQYDFDVSVNSLHVVGPFGIPDPDLTGITPFTGTESDSWLFRNYKMADIVVAYPNAKIINNALADGGFPAEQPLMGAIIIGLGDSSTITEEEKIIEEFKIE
jgi:hypothetical protein